MSEYKLYAFGLDSEEGPNSIVCKELYPVSRVWPAMTEESIQRAKEKAANAVHRYSSLAVFSVIELYRKVD